MNSKWITIPALALMCVVGGACNRADVQEQNAEAGEAIKSAGEETGEAVATAGQAAADETKEATANAGEAAERAGEDIQNAADEAGEKAKAAGENAEAKLDDAGITAKVKAKLLADPEVKGLAIDVDTKDGRVTLSGTAKTSSEKDEAEKLASHTDGVVSVDNQIVVSGK